MVILHSYVTVYQRVKPLVVETSLETSLDASQKHCFSAPSVSPEKLYCDSATW